MADQAKNILIGLFVIAACAVGVFILLFLHPSTGNEGRTIRVRFANIDKVNIGTRVTFAGLPVGEVVEIHELNDPENPRQAHEGFVYPYELILKIDTSVNVYNSDILSLRTSGLLGEKSVAITPMPAEDGKTLVIVNDKLLYANESGSVEETLKEFKDLSDKIEAALDGIILVTQDFRHSHLIDKVTKTVENVQEITANINQPEKIQHILDNVHEISARGLDIVDQGQGVVRKFSDTLNKLDVMAVNLSEFSKETVDVSKKISTIVNKVESGEGTLGRLFMKDDLYLSTASILSKVETLADDVNHYGLLFHSNKEWQRLRSRRSNLLMRLSSPQQFRNFFNDEIDNITTSLSRVSRVMEETESLDPCGQLLENNNFSKVFAELLRRVNSLEESLEMYNQQLEDVKVQQTELSPCSEYCE